MCFKYFILLITLCFSIFADTNESIYPLLTDRYTIFPYDTPVPSHDGKHFAWTVRRKPANDYTDPESHENPRNTPACLKGTKIIIKHLETNTFEEISIPEKNAWAPSWSPDSKSIAFYSDGEGQIELWIYEIASHTLRKPTTVLLDNYLFPIQKLLWSPDGRYVYVMSKELSLPNNMTEPKNSSHFTSTSEKESRNPINEPPTHLVAIDLLSNNISKTLLENNPSSFQLSPSGRHISYQSSRWNNNPDIKSHGLVSSLGVVGSDGYNHVILRENLLSELANKVSSLWHPKKEVLYFIADNALWAGKFSDKGFDGCVRVTKAENKIDARVLGITQDGSYLLVLSQDRKQILIISTEQTSVTVTALPENMDLDKMIINSSGILWEPKKGKILFLASNTDRSLEKSVWSLDLVDGRFSRIRNGNGHFNLVDFSADHKTLFSFYENFSTPKSLIAFNDTLTELYTLSDSTTEHHNLPVGTFAIFESLVPSHDGTNEKVQTAVILPPNAKQGDKLPAIVVQYPGSDLSGAPSNFGGGDDMGGIPQWLLTFHGFAVILPNLTLDDSAIGRPLEAMTERLLPQLQKAAELGYIDIDKVGIIGQSYGGNGSVGILTHTSIFKAAVATNGAYDLASFAYHLNSKGENFWLLWAEADQGRMGVSLFEDPARYINNSPFYRADKISTPLLLIHGKLDGAYPEAGKMFSALKRLNKSVELVVYNKGEHLLNEMPRDDHIDAAKRIIDFFERHLKK